MTNKITKRLIQGKYYGVFVGDIQYALFLYEEHAIAYMQWLQEDMIKLEQD